jgi:hypothetical protein
MLNSQTHSENNNNAWSYTKQLSKMIPKQIIKCMYKNKCANLKDLDYSHKTEIFIG